MSDNQDKEDRKFLDSRKHQAIEHRASQKYNNIYDCDNIIQHDNDNFTTALQSHYSHQPCLYRLTAPIEIDVKTHLPAQREGYPYYNIILADNNQTHCIQLAVAGFSTKNLIISVHGVYLTIIGQKQQQDYQQYLYKGIASRAFVKKFLITNNGQIGKSILRQGILNIYINYYRDKGHQRINILEVNNEPNVNL